MESDDSTSSRLPARIIMKIFCGECCQCGPSGQEPAQTPHCMHILTQWPSSTLASTSLRKLLLYLVVMSVRSSISAEALHRRRAHLDELGNVVVDHLGDAGVVRDRHFV